MNSFIDLPSYTSYMQTIAKLSPLFSASDEPYIDYRFVENVFALTSGGRNISRSDKVFDALIGENLEMGVGVKTFRMPTNSNSQYEKIQEFTKFAREAGIKNLKGERLVTAISEFRNNRVEADAREFNINLSESFYHCFIRSGGKGLIYETPYPLINMEKLKPTDKNGQLTSTYEHGSHVYFTDETNFYKYSFSKNVLYKRFDLCNREKLTQFDLEIDPEIWKKLSGFFENSFSSIITSQYNGRTFDENTEELEYVVLPLYGVKNGKKIVFEKSGINQWNASGRLRKYGEAYIPIPSVIHQLKPDFFPPRDQYFSLSLPNSKIVNASVCQDNSKALMSKPNDQLCQWLYKVIDPDFSDYDFNKPPNREPFTYEDLLRVGKDCVVVYKLSDDFQLEFGEIGKYEEFLENFE